MAIDMKGKHLLSISDLTQEEIYQIIETAMMLKLDRQTGRPHELLKGKTLGMIFQKPSLRTRVAFEAAMTQLGGHGIYLGPEDIKLGKREKTEDIAIVLSRMVDVIMARVFGHEIVEELARYSKVPVINGLSDFEHPTQILGDLLTIYEKFRRLDGLKLAYVGDGNNVAHSLIYGAALTGMFIHVATPNGYEPDEGVVRKAREFAKSTGAVVEITNDPQQAVKDADVVYTDVWASMGQEAEAEERKKVFQPYQVNIELFEKAKPTAVFMHCLPAHYEEEVTLEVGRHPRSVIFDQAENRMHSIKAILVHVTR
ncbi:MAG: ornithine carbamoyltransferase [Thermotogota bacterium]|nr:ornithine carbamoyltransferase [Thermotogota bacterium]MDK2864429.1 ornithine carbamoyltransferase [Thermotogota bacterium]HCZ05541.1 ornithine carbamoyltransferase [Thermotogota bacterium]